MCGHGTTPGACTVSVYGWSEYGPTWAIFLGHRDLRVYQDGDQWAWQVWRIGQCAHQGSAESRETAIAQAEVVVAMETRPTQAARPHTRHAHYSRKTRIEVVDFMSYQIECGATIRDASRRAAKRFHLSFYGIARKWWNALSGIIPGSCVTVSLR